MNKILDSLEKTEIIEKDIESEFDKEVKEFLIQINSRISNGYITNADEDNIKKYYNIIFNQNISLDVMFDRILNIYNIKK